MIIAMELSKSMRDSSSAKMMQRNQRSKLDEECKRPGATSLGGSAGFEAAKISGSSTVEGFVRCIRPDDSATNGSIQDYIELFFAQLVAEVDAQVVEAPEAELPCRLTTVELA
jgi:hypothetical protein